MAANAGQGRWQEALVSGVPEKVRNRLQQALLGVRVREASGHVSLLLREEVAREIGPDWVKTCCEILERCLPGVSRLQAEVVPVCPDTSLEEKLGQMATELRRELCQRWPLLAGCQDSIELGCRDGELALQVPPGFPLFMLLDKQVELERWLCRRVGRSLRLRVEQGQEDLPTPYKEIQERKEEAEEHQIKQLARCDAAASNQEYSLLAGRPISGDPVAMVQLPETAEDLVLAGRVFDLKWRPGKEDRQLMIARMTDGTDSLVVKALLPETIARRVRETLDQQGVGIKARGRLEIDRFEGEPVLWARHLEKYELLCRQDQAVEKRVELHLHTRMSALDALVDLEPLFATLKRWGHRFVAITDHGVVQAFPEAYRLGQKYGIQVLFGMEAYLIEDEKQNHRPFHTVLLVADTRGLENLYRLVTCSHLEYFHQVPRIPRHVLSAHRQGLLVGTACEAGELARAYRQGKRGQELAEIARYYDYLEIQPVENNDFLVRQGEMTRQDLMDMNRSLVELGQSLQMPVAATGDVHFLEPEEALLRRIIMAGQGYADAEEQPPLYLKTTDEMLEDFSYLGRETAREVVISGPERLALSLEPVQPIPSRLHTPEIEGADERIRDTAYARAHEWYGDPLPETVDSRMDQELSAIIGHGFAVIYLIAEQLARKSLQDGYLVGSRGSVGSSLIATLLDITEVNPLPPHERCPECKFVEFHDPAGVGCGFDLPRRGCPRCGSELVRDGHHIPFAVFLGIDGSKVPDIDLNFSGEYQPVIHREAERIFGQDRVFRAGTISTIAERTAFGFVKGYLRDRGWQRRQAEVERLVQGCTGIKRTTGQHPGGLVILPQDTDVHQFTPLQYPADSKTSGVVTTHFDYHSISSRLLKLDLLGHDDPTALRMLEELTGVEALSIPCDDQATMSIFSSVEQLGYSDNLFEPPVGTVGIPEFGTPFVRRMLYETRPRTFADLVRISGLSHGTDVWLNNARDLIAHGVAGLSQVISTRDDIMTFLVHQGLEAGTAFSIMERVRKGEGLTEDQARQLVQQGIPDWYVESCRRIKYMFPKAHAAAYVMMAFRIAYFKVHYPEAFYATYLSVRADEFDVSQVCGGWDGIKKQLDTLRDKGMQALPRERSMLTILEVVLEALARGLRLAEVHVGCSHPQKFLLEGQTLRPPLVAIPGLGEAAAENLAQARRVAPFSSVEDMRQRAQVSTRVVDSLREHGALQGLAESDQLAFFA